MRTLGIVVTAALAVALLATPVLAAPATGDFISGSGYRLNEQGEKRVHFKIDAREAGAGVSGSYAYRSLFSDLSFSGAITCLWVDGTRATAGGVITRITPGDFGFGVGDVFVIVFADNGAPYRNQAGPDLVSFTDVYLADDPAFPGCTDPWANEAFLGVVGNVTVKDAP